MKIGVIGDSTTVRGFRLSGIKDVYEVDEPGKAVEKLRELVKAEFGLIIISDYIASKIKEDIEKLTEGKVTPLIVEIPTKKGPVERKVDPIKELVRKAVGIDIKFG